MIYCQLANCMVLPQLVRIINMRYYGNALTGYLGRGSGSRQAGRSDGIIRTHNSEHRVIEEIIGKDIIIVMSNTHLSDLLIHTWPITMMCSRTYHVAVQRSIHRYNTYAVCCSGATREGLRNIRTSSDETL